MNIAPHFSAQTCIWPTPDSLFEKLDREFRFTLDVCALPENAKCSRFFTPDDDGLLQPWQGVVWCNPPYGNRINDWCEKAFRESHNGATVVILLPARTDTRWFHIFTPATPYYTTLSVQRKRSSLNKPGRAGLSFNGKVQYGVAASLSGITFLPKLRHHHAHRNQVPRRPAELPRTSDHSGTIPATRRRNGAAVTAVAPGFYSTKLGAFGARFQPIIYCNSVI